MKLSIINYQLSIILLFFAAFAGCGDDDKDKEPVVAVTGVVLNHSTLIADFPGEAQLTATVEPADATNKEVTWHIEPVDVAAIGDNGELMTLRPGKATISVTTEHGLFSDTCVLTVMATSSVSSIEATVEEGASYNDKVNTVQAAIWKSYSTETGDVYASIAEGAYTDGGFPSPCRRQLPTSIWNRICSNWKA